MRTCIKCKQEREDNEFYIYPNGRITNTCRNCQRISQKAYDASRAKKRSEEYYKLKAGINEIDKNAFFTAVDAYEVLGGE